MLDQTDDIHPLFHGAPKSTEFRKLRKRLVQNVREAMDQYGMVAPADARARRGAGWSACQAARTVIPFWRSCTSCKWRGLLPVDLLACNLDQGQPGFPATVLPEFLSRMGVPHRIEYQDTYSIVMDKVPQGVPSARSARGCGAATSTGSRARKDVRPSCWGITVTTSSRRSS